MPPFPFRALAALTARASLGGPRETALGCLLGARIAAGALPPYRLTAEQRRARAADAHGWLATLAPPAEARAALARLLDLSAAPTPAPRTLAAALREAVEASAPALDEPSRTELVAVVAAAAALEPAP